MPATDLTTVQTAASFLGVSPTDASLPLLVGAASSQIAAYLGYPVHQRLNVVEQVAGTGSPYLFLKAGQVTAIKSVVVNGSTLDPSTYALEDGLRGRIVGLVQGFPFTGTATGGIVSTPLHAHATGAIQVTFDSGWVTPGQNAADAQLTVTLPDDIQLACLDAVTAYYRRKGRDGDVQSVSLGDGSFSYGDKGALPSMTRAKLLPYRKELWGIP